MSSLISLTRGPKLLAAVSLFLFMTCFSPGVMAESGIGNPERGAEIYRSQCLRCQPLRGQVLIVGRTYDGWLLQNRHSARERCDRD